MGFATQAWDDPIVNFFSFVSKKWMFLIIKSIAEWCQSFSDIQKSLGNINPRILSSRLKELEDMGFIRVSTKENTKNKTIYCLSDKGMCFTYNIKTLEKWVQKWEKKESMDECPKLWE